MQIKKESHLYELLEKYSKGEEHLGEELINLQEKIEGADILVPFLGTQGAGKSTLINALLGEDILPNEADETTCIPVELRFGETTSAKAIFKDGKIKELGTEQTEIAEFVDNSFNPGNEKCVSKIIIEKKLDILRDGLILVDLPGVGSLTHANEETTTEYIKNLSAAVFLFSTTPPILKKEAAFIKNIWRGINTAYFVQNVWDDNSETEVDEGLNHNKTILSNISKEINVSFEGNIIPVNAYAAAFGRFRNKTDKVEESNILSLESTLKSFAVNYKEESKKAFSKRVKQVVDYLEDSLEEAIQESNMSYEEILDRLNKKKKFYEDRNEEIKTISHRIDDKIYDSKKEIKQFSKEIAERKTNTLRTEMFRLIDKGVVDGEKLDTAFGEYQSDHEEEVCEEVFEKLSQLCEDLQEEYNKLEVSLGDIDQRNEDKMKVNKKEELKWEKGLEAVMNLGIDIGGTIAGTAIGAVVGGALSGAAAGPVGVAVGIVGGLAICLIGHGVSSLTKKGITSVRGAETKKMLEPILSEYSERIEKYVKSYCNQCFDDIEKGVNIYIESMKNQLEKINDEISNIRREGQQMKYSENDLQVDLDYVKKWGFENE